MYVINIAVCSMVRLPEAFLHQTGLPGLSAGISDWEDLGQGPGICVFNKYSRYACMQPGFRDADYFLLSLFVCLAGAVKLRQFPCIWIFPELSLSLSF